MKTIVSLVSLFLVFETTAQTTRIAFGSCARQSHALTIFDTILKHDPTHFIFLGDNIYGDTKDMAVMRAKYDTLGMKPGFKHLSDSTTVWATWDDHDYGMNDIGKRYSKKKQSRKIFLEFFKEPKDSERWKHKGIYTSYLIKDSALTIQVIVLDTRTFRDDLILNNKGQLLKDSIFTYDREYLPNPSKKATLLGKQQWKWLREELLKPADVRIIASSIQFSHTFNGYESWNNFPNEQQRLLNTIAETKANGVLVISGDVHYGEISALNNNTTYPIYDATSSGLSSKWHLATPNSNRIQGPIMENNFGLISFEKTENDYEINIQLIDLTDVVRADVVLPLSLLKF